VSKEEVRLRSRVTERNRIVAISKNELSRPAAKSLVISLSAASLFSDKLHLLRLSLSPRAYDTQG
jgi:hypothetical protein